MEENDVLVAKLIEDIDAIPSSVTTGDKEDILALKARYEALNEALRARVTNYSKVTDALTAIEKLEKEPVPPPVTGVDLSFTVLLIAALSSVVLLVICVYRRVKTRLKA